MNMRTQNALAVVENEFFRANIGYDKMSHSGTPEFSESPETVMVYMMPNDGKIDMEFEYTMKNNGGWFRRPCASGGDISNELNDVFHLFGTHGYNAILSYMNDGGTYVMKFRKAPKGDVVKQES